MTPTAGSRTTRLSPSARSALRAAGQLVLEPAKPCTSTTGVAARPWTPTVVGDG